MITTAFLILLAAFESFYLTSKQFKHRNPPLYMAKIRSNANAFRGLAFVLLSLATILFVFSFGWLSGLVAIIVAMMTAGSLVVLLQPFSYVSLKTVAGIYFSVLLLEIII